MFSFSRVYALSNEAGTIHSNILSEAKPGSQPQIPTMFLFIVGGGAMAIKDNHVVTKTGIVIHLFQSGHYQGLDGAYVAKEG